MSTTSRKQKLVQSRLQLRLIAAFAGTAVATSLLQIYLTNRVIVRIGESLPPEAEAAARSIPRILMTNVAISIGILVPVMLLVGLLVTHRIAGPATRMERWLRERAAGKGDGGPCRVRDGDELQSLCEAINLAFGETSEDGDARERDAA